MTKAELAAALAAAGVRPAAYSLDGGLPSERLCLEERPDSWAVYYSERGERTGETLYPTEAEACDAFYAQIMRSPSTNPEIPPDPVYDWMRDPRNQIPGGAARRPGTAPDGGGDQEAG
ncbi:hypothetical protein KDL01_37135 [Actinospica durhamensis]|uniref:Uncharacterized protein n=1 Tax=Actinospica durhamensis TaxID=1508375 RepID=A0A941EVK0_9ACTN|nr:hypothetical protein [Actinospica durhamensis]MBR7838952.1 hypothetical protein [Actinospica durhamensis]